VGVRLECGFAYIVRGGENEAERRASVLFHDSRLKGNEAWVNPDCWVQLHDINRKNDNKEKILCGGENEPGRRAVILLHDSRLHGRVWVTYI